MNRVKGISYALAACFIWGLIFVVPIFMTDFSPIEVTVGRYAFYGVASLLMLLKGLSAGGLRYPKAIWLRALPVGLMYSFGYYVWIVLALRWSTPAICALVLGIAPITIAFYGNWKEKECTYRSLMLPSVLIVIGLAVLNVPCVLTSECRADYLLGLLCGFIALANWTWYVVSNASFLKKHAYVNGSDWSTLLGVSSLCWTILFLTFSFLLPVEVFDIHKFISWNDSLIPFVAGSAILGLVCAWMGSALWNRASVNLPVSLAGQLTLFETIFGILFFYGVTQSLPSSLDAAGIILLLGAVIYGIRKSSCITHETT